MDETIADRVARLSTPRPGPGRPKILEPPRAKRAQQPTPFPTQEGRDGWEKRHAQGGKHNETAVRADGSFAPHAVVEDPETGCLIWQLSLASHRQSDYPGVPQMVMSRAHGGQRHVSVRRLLWRIIKGEPVPPRITVHCGNYRCVNPDHLVAGNRATHKREEIIATIRAGASRDEVERAAGVTDGILYDYYRSAGIPIPRHPFVRSDDFVGATRPPGVSDRNWAIFVEARHASLRQLAEKHKLTRQRIHQIVQRVGDHLHRTGSTRP